MNTSDLALIGNRTVGLIKAAIRLSVPWDQAFQSAGCSVGIGSGTGLVWPRSHREHRPQQCAGRVAQLATQST